MKMALPVLEGGAFWMNGTFTKALPTFPFVRVALPCLFHGRGAGLLIEDESEVESSPFGASDADWPWLWAQLPKAPRPDIDGFPVNDASGEGEESVNDLFSGFVADMLPAM